MRSLFGDDAEPVVAVDEVIAKLVGSDHAVQTTEHGLVLAGDQTLRSRPERTRS
jgi:hypothetical protein